MKKLLYCYDGPISKDEDEIYYGNAINNDLLKRYEVIADNINVAIRVKKVKKEDVLKRLLKIDSKKYRIKECPNISSLKGILFNRRKCKLILKQEIEKVDYIIIRLPSMIGNLAVNIAKKLNKPYLIELVGCPWDAFWNHSLKGKIIAPIMTLITKRNVMDAPYVLYVTKDFLQKRYPTNGKNISCSNVILDNIDKSVIETRKKHIFESKLKEVKTITTTAAVNVKYKGQKYVLKALYDLKKQGKIFEYWIIGGGDNSYLKRFVEKYKLENQVKFLGPLPHDKVFKELEKTDIYIQPSKQEGLPRALIEAMSMGCLCIGARTGGIPELLEEDYIVRKGNTRDIVNKLKEIKTEEFLQQANINTEKVKKYDAKILQTKREDVVYFFNSNCFVDNKYSYHYIFLYNK